MMVTDQWPNPVILDQLDEDIRYTIIFNYHQYY